ncbi:hypothetical protein BDV59DRAFT_55113 [Aspergillus ambiguus]|uniref:gamma-glutamylcyclotransferase family protein n=1 Tax=Aspergillus ambiguus TaxID=176160 RepID=UPI003CCE165B
MKYKSWYPRDFIRALQTILTQDQITRHLQDPNGAPRFLYGALMLPTVLKYFLSIDQTVDLASCITPAVLSGYRLSQFTESSTPVLVPSDSAAVVEGMLVFGLNAHQRNALFEVEAGLMDLADVQVQILQTERAGPYQMRCTRVVDAGTFVWRGSHEGLIPVTGSMWSLDGFPTGPFYRQIVESQQRQTLDRPYSYKQ